jgi:hypothetical protein
VRRLREYGRNCRQWFHRARSLAAIIASDFGGSLSTSTKRAGTAAPAIFPVYFTYAADFEYLRLSLRSLNAYARDRIGRIHVYEDWSYPFTAAQRDALTIDSACAVVFRRTRAPMAWGGVTLLHNELRAFTDLSAELPDDDLIMKVDSDVLFTADWLFSAAINANADVVGQPVASIPTILKRSVSDIQGGCYFLRAGAVRQLRRKRLLGAARQVVKTSSYDLWTVPEDRTMSQWAHAAGLRFRMIDFYLLDLAPLRASPFVSDAEIGRCLEQEGAFAVIHFERCKDKMAPCQRWLDGQRQSPAVTAVPADR